jgi:hypothetical protein
VDGLDRPRTVVAEARQALGANEGYPSEHALTFVMHRLFELGKRDVALIFEEYQLLKTIRPRQVVHLLFALSGNDASSAPTKDLKACGQDIEQHAITFRIPDHQTFIIGVYKGINTYGARN